MTWWQATSGAFGDWEDDAEFEAEWARADAAAALVLSRALGAEDSVPPSPAEVDLAGQRLVDALSAGTPEGDYFQHACGWDPGSFDTRDSFDVNDWLDAAGATISPPEDPQTPPEEQAAVGSLQHADWLALVVGLVRRGVGAEATAEAWVADLHALPDLIDIEQEDPDDAWAFESALSVLVPLWQTLGILDDRGRLTTLGRWGLPMALAEVWLPDPAGPVLDESQAATVLGVLAQGPTSYADLRQQAAKHGVFADEETLGARPVAARGLRVRPTEARARAVPRPRLGASAIGSRGGARHRTPRAGRAGAVGPAGAGRLALGAGGELKTVFRCSEPRRSGPVRTAARAVPTGWLDAFAWVRLG